MLIAYNMPRKLNGSREAKELCYRRVAMEITDYDSCIPIKCDVENGDPNHRRTADAANADKAANSLRVYPTLLADRAPCPQAATLRRP